jgi:hypothetical protein
MIKKIKKSITIYVYSSYSESESPWYMTKKTMSKKEFLKAIKNWKVQEFKTNDSWRTNKSPTYSWQKGYINTLHD